MRPDEYFLYVMSHQGDPAIHCGWLVLFRCMDHMQKHVRPGDLVYGHGGVELGDRPMWIGRATETLISTAADTNILTFAPGQYWYFESQLEGWRAKSPSLAAYLSQMNHRNYKRGDLPQEVREDLEGMWAVHASRSADRR